MKNSEEPSSAAPRSSINGRLTLLIRIANSGDPGIIAGTMISANTRKRTQAISIEGRLAERYFAVTSETPRNVVESRISAMPLKGRSARAGAPPGAEFASDRGIGAVSSLATTIGFFPGNDKCALSSLAAAAGGGVTRKTRAEIFESGEALKNANWACVATPVSGTPICAEGALKQFVKQRGRALSKIYSIGRLRGFDPRGNDVSSAEMSAALSVSVPAAAFSAACSELEALGIGNTGASRARKLSATWRGVALCCSAIFCSTLPPALAGEGKSLWPNGE